MKHRHTILKECSSCRSAPRSFLCSRVLSGRPVPAEHHSCWTAPCYLAKNISKERMLVLQMRATGAATLQQEL